MFSGPFTPVTLNVAVPLVFGTTLPVHLLVSSQFPSPALLQVQVTAWAEIAGSKANIATSAPRNSRFGKINER